MKRLFIYFVFIAVLLKADSVKESEIIPPEIVNLPQPIPPTFITINPIPPCNPKNEFPQTNRLPHWARAHQVQFSCDFYPMDHVSWVLYHFYEKWSEEFGDPGNRIRHAFTDLIIEWGPEQKTVNNIYDISGRFMHEAEVFGLMTGPHRIWVWARGPLSSTALVHELAHVALYHQCGNPDPDHEGDEFSCWSPRVSNFIHRLNTELSESYDL